MKKIKWTNLEKKLLNSLENIHDEDFLKLLKKYKIDIELGNPPYNSDEKLLGAIGLITDTPRKKIIECHAFFDIRIPPLLGRQLDIQSH